MKRVRPETIVVAVMALCTIAGVASVISAGILDIAILKTIGIISIGIGVATAFLPLLCLGCVLFYEKIMKRNSRSQTDKQ